MEQAEYAVSGTGSTQCDKILNVLNGADGGWVEMPDLWRASGAFAIHSRVADLRKRGHNIEHRSERVGGIVHSFYRLVAEDVAV